jgi:hypothetical protein
MVTGTWNAALVEWEVQYRISDPVKFIRGGTGQIWRNTVNGIARAQSSAM